MMTPTALRLALLAALLATAACGTVEGFGRDLQTAGGALSREARAAQ